MMIKKVKTALLAGLIPLGLLGGVAGIAAVVAPQAASATISCPTGYTGQTSTGGLTDYSQSNLSVTADTTSPYGVFPGSGNGAYSGWDLCYKVSGTDVNGDPYGLGFLYNHGTALWAAADNTQGGWVVASATGAGPHEQFQWACEVHAGWPDTSFIMQMVSAGGYVYTASPSGYLNNSTTTDDVFKWNTTNGFCY